MEEDTQQTVERIRRIMDGNGRPGLVKEHDRIRDQSDEMYRDMYHNPRTGDPGMVAHVRGMRDDIRRAVAWIKGGVAVITTVVGVAAWAITTYLQ